MASPKHPEMEHRTGAVNQSARDNPLTGSALQALVRGWIAGTAGLPGDMEGLARKGINFSFGPGGVSVNPDSALPTTDFYKEWLPGKQVGDENVTEVGSLFGGVGATKPVSLAKGALTRVAQAAPGPLAGTRAAMKGVIKAPGGNWLNGSVEDALKGLKRPGANPEQMLALDPEYQALGRQGNALNQFIDKQLTRYVKNDMATERDPIRALAERGTLHFEPTGTGNPGLGTRVNREHVGFDPQGLGQSTLARQWESASDALVRPRKAGDVLTDKSIGGSGVAEKKIADNPWLSKVPADSQVNEIYNGSRTQDLGFDHLIDELRNATNPNSGLPANLLLKPESLDRVSVPQAVEHVAKINAWREAQKVEANQAIANNAATVLHKEYPEGNYFRAGEGSFFTPDQQAAELFGKNFGGKVGRYRLDAKKTATESDLEKVVREYGVRQEGVPLGQYLEQGDNAVTPYSSFIRDALRKQGFDSVSLNDGMAKQPSLVALDDSIIKPHTDNPKGLRWVELKKGKLPEGWSEKNDALGTPNIYDQTGQHFTQAGTHKDPSFAALKDALKYEGDTMGHCVGGYCDDVASGKSRIFSLRDAKGQPHVTVETKPNGRDPYAVAFDNLPRAEREALRTQAGLHPQGAGFVSHAEQQSEGAKVKALMQERYPELADIEKQENIVQIKGKSNKKPNDEYLPFVQDFVKSGKWSDVGDLQNSGLRRTRDALNELEQKTLREKGQTFGDYLSDDELKGLQSQWDVKKGFASGGSVTAGPWWDSYQSGQSDEQPAASTPTLTLEDFRKRISPNMLDAEGKFKAPVAGVNYMLEGMTPEQAYSAAQAQTGPEIDGGGSDKYQNIAREQMLDPSWRTGPNNGGGFLGGLGAAAQGMFDGVRTNPAIMAALTAGVGSAVNPAISEGLQSAGMSANAAKTAAPMVLNAGKTVLSGGSLADAAKGAAVGYAGGEIGGAVKDTTGSDFMGNAARTLTQSALNGGSLSIDELAAQYASGKLTDLSGLPPQVASIVVNLARNRKTTPGAMVGALSQVARKAS